MAPVFLFCHKKSYLCTLSHYRVIRMNHVDTIWREWLPPRTGGTACSATPKGGGGSLSARHNSLSFMEQAAVKKSDSAGIFLNKYLEIRENRVHTQELARQDTANHLICKELAIFFHLPQAIFSRKPLRHKPSHRRRVAAWRRLSYIPGTVSRTSMLCPQVSGAFCIQQQTDKPNMNI